METNWENTLLLMRMMVYCCQLHWFQIELKLNVENGKQSISILANQNYSCDVGNKQGFLEATVETALRRSDLRDEFLSYLVKVVEKEVGAIREVAC